MQPGAMPGLSPNVSPAGSGDDVGRQLVLDDLDLVLQEQLALLQALDGQLVGVDGKLERYNFSVEGTMLVAELHQQLSQFTVVSSLHARSARPQMRSIHANCW